MAENKYGHHLLRNCVVMGKKGRLIVSTRDAESFGGGNFSLECIYIPSPRIMTSQSHQHGFDQYLCFCSSNPDDPNDFEAEIALSLGEELEKQIITTPSIAHIPSGLHHGPLEFVRVDKPVLFIDIAITGEYSRVGGTED
jgi:hypothetical protein